MLSSEQWQAAQKQPPCTTWRLLDTGLQPAALNMAIDEAILEAYTKKLVPPTLRFYGWQPAAVSIGYFQHGEREIDFAACKQAGVSIVRRLTGGRAVLHKEELTYSIIVGEAYPGLPMTITASYCYLSQGLLQGIQHLGLDAKLTIPAAAYARKTASLSTAACFDAPSHYELTIAGRKLIGSAQVRKHGVILQHGSILLHFTATDLTRLLNVDAAAQARTQKLLETHVIDLQTALQRPTSYEETRKAMEWGFSKALNIKLVPGRLTPEELALARTLAATKYQEAAWTKKR